MTARLVALLLVVLLAGAPARAAERIVDFDVAVTVLRDGDIKVVETIDVVAEGAEIRRGIYRDLPRYYLKGGKKLPYAYDFTQVTRDGAREKHAVEAEGNAVRLRIGDADVMLPPGPHRYVIAYGVKNQVRYFAGYDELYWNVTGNYWNFPIERARAVVTLPGGAGATQVSGYTGREGATDRNYAYHAEGGGHRFLTTAPLPPGEGLTVAVGFAKGVVDPPSATDARAEWWARHAPLALLGAAFAAIGAFYAAAWSRIGRDPPKGPVFARYEPPKGLSPAAVHHVFHRGFSGHGALIATLVDLGVRKRVRIDPDLKRKVTTVRRIDEGAVDLPEPDAVLERALFAGANSVVIGGRYDAVVTRANETFRAAVGRAYGAPYFRWNRTVLMVAVALSAAAVFAAAKLAIEWTAVETALAVALAAMALVASYFLPAPTPMGQDVRTEIEGFRLYLKTAEELQLNAVKVGSEAPPPMTVERYERFLPYAVALGVEKPWSEHFESLMPKESADYRPGWTTANFSGGRALSGFNSALVSSLSTGVAESLPKSSGSSGSGGGGSSGGGGGGGGGGGW